MSRAFLPPVLTACLALLPVPALTAQTAITATTLVGTTILDGSSSSRRSTLLQVPVSYAGRAWVDVAYINTVTTASGTSTSLEETLSFKIAKSEPRFLYPLRYLHTVRNLSAAGGTSYRAYTIDPPLRDYTVTCAIWKGSTPFESISVSPSKPTASVNNQHHVVMSLTGEAPPPLPAPDLSNRVFYLPHPPGPTFDTGDGLLVPLDLAGTILDSRQLLQLKAQDDALHAANPYASTRYWLRHMLRFRSSDFSLQGLNLVVRSPEICHSQVSFTLDEAQIGVVNAQSIGYMPSAYISNHESLSGQGILNVTVKNEGSLAADFQVVVRDGYPAVLPVLPTVGVTLEPGAQTTIEVPIPGTENLQASAYVWVDLQSPQAMLFDSLQVYFDRTTVVTRNKR